MVTYKLVENGGAIECLVCGYVSHNENDVRFKYCGMCHDFHDQPVKKIKKFLKRMKDQSSKKPKKLAEMV